MSFKPLARGAFAALFLLALPAVVWAGQVRGKVLSLDRALEPSLPALLWLLDVPIEDPQWQRLDPPQRRLRARSACPAAGPCSAALFASSDGSASGAGGVSPTTIRASNSIDAALAYVRCTVVVPVGKSIVVGGMTLDPSSTGGDARQLYLILEVVGAAK